MYVKESTHIVTNLVATHYISCTTLQLHIPHAHFPVCYLDCLYDSDRLLPAFWPCLPFDILSVCHLPRPLHCPCCWFCLAFVPPVTVSEPCLFDLLLFINKAAFGSNDTASSLHISSNWDISAKASQTGYLCLAEVSEVRYEWYIIIIHVLV